jgi:iron complex outermembrane receptor protein
LVERIVLWQRGSAALLAVTLLGATSSVAQPVQDRLIDLSLEELSNLEITSVSKRAERLSDAPTSVFVITSADIRRSGATSLPEALRLAPNLQVARVAASGYAVSARGFNSSSANKLLVLIDGRSVYSPLFSGVFWDVQDVTLEDIDRIEVISGPGGTLWGVNAVNGVINVITRSAALTQGALVAAGAGNREDRATFRYGGKAGGGVDYRVYVSHTDFKHTETEAGGRVNDASHQTQIGFRADVGSDGDKLMVKGDAYTGRRDQPLPGAISITGVHLDLGPISVSGANLIGVWERRLEGGSSMTVQAYYDRTQRTVPPTFSDMQDIVDLELQYSTGPIGAHTPVWGAEYRYGMDRVTNSTYIALLPAQLDQTWASVLAQDEIVLQEDLRLTLGARVERNDYTGTEFLPTVRLAWKVAPNHLLWTAASRTVRAPSRLDHDTFVPGQPPFLLRGGPDVIAETAVDYELGYRGQLTSNTSASLTVFHTVFDNLHTQQIDPSFTYIFFDNGMQGTTNGFETWGSYQATSAWRLHAGFSRLSQSLRLKPGSNDGAAVAAAEGANPGRWWSLRSSLDLGAQTEFDVTVRYVAPLSHPDVAGYTATDLRYGRQLGRGVELSIDGQNIFGRGHGEFTNIATRTQFKPEVFVKLECRF